MIMTLKPMAQLTFDKKTFGSPKILGFFNLLATKQSHLKISKL